MLGVSVQTLGRLMTAEAVAELALEVGDEAVCVREAANVIVETPARKEARA